MNFTHVKPPFWDQQDVFVVGGGPSIRGFNFDRLWGVRVGCNDAAFRAECDVLVSIDKIWINRRTEATSQFPGEVYLGVKPNFDFKNFGVMNANYLQWAHRAEALSDDPAIIHGWNSGFAAMDLCRHKRARRVIMLGFDMDETNMDRSWHRSHEWVDHDCKHALLNYPGWRSQFDALAEEFKKNGTIVINANPESRILSFDRIPFEDIHP